MLKKEAYQLKVSLFFYLEELQLSVVLGHLVKLKILVNLLFTPVFAVVGRERFCINHWLLPGREKAVERIDEFIRETAELIPEKIDRKKLLFRYDAGLYSIKTAQVSEDAGSYYLVKARTSGALDRVVNENLDVDVMSLKVTDFGGEFYGEFEQTTPVRRRIKTIQDYLLRSAAIVVNHARKSLLKVSGWWLKKLRPDRIQARIGRLQPVTG